MAKLLNDYAYANPVNTFTGLPVDEIKALNEKASEDYNKTYDTKNALDVMYNNIDVEDHNSPIKKRAIQGYKEKIDDLVKKGNYQDAQYLVKNLQKDYLTDNELQGAIKSRKNEADYYNNLKEQLAKGEIDQKRYNYAIINSKNKNNKQLTYNPDTFQYENSFQGTKVGKDLSSEIEKDSNDFIKDWKATGMKPFTDAKGRKYSVENIGGAEKVLVDGKGVDEQELQTAIKQHILNQSKYKDYLNEERNIEKFNRTYNPETRTEEPFQRKHLGEFTDQELQKIQVGADDSEILKLSKSKNLAEKTLAKELIERKKNFNPDDPNQLEDIYNTQYMKRKMNELSYPSAEKGSYNEYNYHLFTDHAALEAQKHRYAKELKKMDKSNPGAVIDFGAVEATGKDIDKLHQNNQQLKQNLDLSKQNLEKAKGTDLEPMRRAEYQSALNKFNISETNVKESYENISEQSREKLKDRIAGFFVKKEGRMSNWDYRPNPVQLQNLINESIKNKDGETAGLLTLAKQKFDQDGSLTEELANKLANRLAHNTDYLKIASDIDKERVDRSAVAYDNKWSTDNWKSGIQQISGAIGGLFHSQSSRNNVQDIIRNDYEEHQNEKEKKNIVMIPDQGQKFNTSTANEYHQTARTVLQHATALSTSTGENLGDIMKQPFYGLDAKGKPVAKTIDLEKTLVALAPGSADGQPKISVTFKDKDGNDLHLADDARKAFFVKSENPQAMDVLYKIGEDYARETNDKSTELKLKGERVFGSQLQDIKLGQDSDPITIQNEKGVPISIKFKGVAKGTSQIVDATTGKPMFEGRVFKSRDDLFAHLAASE